MKKAYFLSLFILGILIILSCKSIPECISKNSKAITIKWGYSNNEKDSINKYMLTTDLKVFEIIKDNQNNETAKQINKIDEKKYCSLLNQTTKTMLKTQTLYEPCNECKFIEFSNPNINIELKFNWNYKYIHSGTTMVSELYDSLMAITKNSK